MDQEQPQTGWAESPTHRVRRMRWDGWRAVIGAAVFAISLWLISTPPPAWEESMFRAINNLPRLFEYLLLPVQQFGMMLAIPVGAAILWRIVREWVAPTGLFLGGMIFGWAAAKLIKEAVGRARPTALYGDIQLRFDTPTTGLGFPSGHAVVAFTLAVVLSPYMRPAYRWVLYGLAVATCIARVFNAAHMPLDVIGGAAYGAVVGSVINLLVGLSQDRAPGPTR